MEIIISFIGIIAIGAFILQKEDDRDNSRKQAKSDYYKSLSQEEQIVYRKLVDSMSINSLSTLAQIKNKVATHMKYPQILDREEKIMRGH